MWVNVQVWLRGPLFEIRDYNNLGILSTLFVILLSLLSVGMVIFHSRPTNIIFGIIIGVTYSLLFKLSSLNLVGMFLMVILFFHAEDIVMGEMRERIKMNSRVILRKGLTNFIIGFFILMSFAAYQSPAIEEFKNIKKLPSSSELFVRSIVEQVGATQLNDASGEEKELILSQATREVIHKANTVLEPYFQFAPPALAFGLFLVLWGVGWIFIWLSTFLGMLIFFILKKSRFFMIEEYDVKAQKLII